MFNVVLVSPQIPPNTGNVIRLCANTGARLHLVEPMGFALDDARMRRAGLDYHEFASVAVYPDYGGFVARARPDPFRTIAFSARATRALATQKFQPGDWLVFGSETEGLSESVRAHLSADRIVRLPMLPGQRSLNLSNAVAVVVFEAWRQNHYLGAL